MKKDLILFGSLIVNFFFIFQNIFYSSIHSSFYNTDITPINHSEDLKSGNTKHYLIFIAIGSAPQYSQRREEIRKSWLKWIDSDKHIYKFFTDSSMEESQKLNTEEKKYSDLIILQTESGRQHYGNRAIHAMHYAFKNFNFSYFVRLDDDSFPCLPAISNELEFHRPRSKFVWGKYWFRKGNANHSWVGRNRMDENLMIFSQDVASFILDSVGRNVINNDHYKDILLFDGGLTLAINFAFWSHFLNLTIFDDRERIDSQQKYLTNYMHQPLDKKLYDKGIYGKFCQDFIYSHHVYSGIMEAVYEQTDHEKLIRKYHKGHSPPRINYPTRENYLFETRHFSRKLPQCACTSLYHNKAINK